MKYYAHFKYDGRMWHCLEVWNFPYRFANFAAIKELYMSVAEKPPIGFCKRPHAYI